jgi:hypothetical protein
MGPPRIKGGRRGGGGAGGGAGRAVAARNDAEEASLDAQAEMDDTVAALNNGGESAGESAGARAAALPPAGLLQRRLDKEKQEKEQAIKDKELL